MEVSWHLCCKLGPILSLELTQLPCRGGSMTKRPVQYDVVDAPNADVAAAAPGFRAVWLSKDHLRDQLMQRGDVPKDAKLYFWDGELWLSWEDPDDLPGPESDPLRIKVVRQQAGLTLSDELFRERVRREIELVHAEPPSKRSRTACQEYSTLPIADCDEVKLWIEEVQKKHVRAFNIM
ncbi:hypothetical protein ABBQ38_014172 [Trebouxia sp. C0009 RCD-2024]